MAIWPRARKCSARRSYRIGAIGGAKPSHPDTSATAGCGPGVSGRKVRYFASGFWARLGEAERGRAATAARTIGSLRPTGPRPSRINAIALARLFTATVFVRPDHSRRESRGIGDVPTPVLPDYAHELVAPLSLLRCLYHTCFSSVARRASRTDQRPSYRRRRWRPCLGIRPSGVFPQPPSRAPSTVSSSHDPRTARRPLRHQACNSLVPYSKEDE